MATGVFETTSTPKSVHLFAEITRTECLNTQITGSHKMGEDTSTHISAMRGKNRVLSIVLLFPYPGVLFTYAYQPLLTLVSSKFNTEIYFFATNFDQPRFSMLIDDNVNPKELQTHIVNVNVAETMSFS